jgi:hypothetical protein
MRRLSLLTFLLVSLSVNAQTDSLKYSRLDSLTPEQLLQYYINEPEPVQFYKGPDIGDSVYYVLDPMALPTKTVEGESLSRHGEDESPEDAETISDSTSSAEQKMKPKISLGAGFLSFDGDVYKSRFQSPLTSRPAFDLAISQRLTRYLQLDFSVLFGKLGANERLVNRQENFQSEIRAGGVNLIYDFGNFIPDNYRARPFVSIGASGFEFLSKTDLKDKNGNYYHYWSDGSIRDIPESAANAQNAKELVRDYKYESDIRELNKDGFGKYPERAWAFPVGAGFVMKITDRVDMKLNFQYFFSTTDYLDGITHNSVNLRKGAKQKDNFSYTSFSLQYDLLGKLKPRSKKYADTLSDAFWLAFDAEDSDKDGVTDFKDNCHGTEASAKVDEFGCPLDEDGDGIPNHRDDEPATTKGSPVNDRGVTQSDEYWKEWYAAYMNDTLPSNVLTEQVGNIYAADYQKTKKKKKKGEKEKDNYTVELVRYTGSIPSDELAFLLSIGDITSNTLPDGTTVVYTSGNYDKLSYAIKRRDEFRQEGNKGAGVSKIKGRDIIPIPENELEVLLKNELEDLMNVNVDSASTREDFGKSDVVYRVQLGAFKNKISTSVFNTSAGVLELKTGESIFRYVTKGYRSIEEAAAVRADLVVQGYSDAFVTAYKEGKRIPLNQTKATTVDKDYKEDMTENKIFSSVDKKLLTFKVQLGPIKKKSMEARMDEQVKELKDVEKQTTATGSIRYTTGNFSTLEAAETYRKSLEEKGFIDAFIIALFKNEIISIQEATELMK